MKSTDLATGKRINIDLCLDCVSETIDILKKERVVELKSLFEMQRKLEKNQPTMTQKEFKASDKITSFCQSFTKLVVAIRDGDDAPLKLFTNVLSLALSIGIEFNYEKQSILKISFDSPDFDLNSYSNYMYVLKEATTLYYKRDLNSYLFLLQGVIDQFGELGMKWVEVEDEFEQFTIISKVRVAEGY
ncbi:hypothetical protein [Alkalihalobacillus pseudalcaliphilus]|uniref:hypothetical protein n=1 Tax=Alkalihalobacillus pseudalcaliphilus TaxID=79884 RepID=UPI002362FC4B|nr:hypothetical protein [Alkalihalobacillus pseudalcaliphilus]